MTHESPENEKHVDDSKFIEDVGDVLDKLSNQEESAVFVRDPVLEKRILRKVDLRLVPFVWLMSIMNYLDRGNIGNAAAAGMNEDLGLSSSDYSLAVSVFFIGYLLLQVPSNMLLAKSRPRWYLSGLLLAWGGVCLSVVGVHDKGGLMAVRLCLGIIEAGFFPGVLLYMSAWYKKTELARRWSIFVTAAWFSGAFSGLLVVIALINGLSNLSSIYGAYIWPSFTAPRYMPGFVTTDTFMFGVFLAAGASICLLQRYPQDEPKLTTVRTLSSNERRPEA